MTVGIQHKQNLHGFEATLRPVRALQDIWSLGSCNAFDLLQVLPTTCLPPVRVSATRLHRVPWMVDSIEYAPSNTARPHHCAPLSNHRTVTTCLVHCLPLPLATPCNRDATIAPIAGPLAPPGQPSAPPLPSGAAAPAPSGAAAAGGGAPVVHYPSLATFGFGTQGT